MEKKMTVLEEITEVVHWFRDLKSDFSGLNELMFQRQRLSGFLFVLATEIAESRKDWSESQANYEIKKNQKRVTFMKLEPAQKADYMARANLKKELEEDKTNEAIYYGSKQIYDAVTQVLEAMAQKIAHLRQEWHLKQYQNG